MTFQVATGSLGLWVSLSAPIHTRVCTMGMMPSHRIDQMETRRSISRATAVGIAPIAPLHLIGVDSPSSTPAAITPFQVRAAAPATTPHNMHEIMVPSSSPEREYEMKKPSAATKAAAIQPARL